MRRRINSHRAPQSLAQKVNNIREFIQHFVVLVRAQARRNVASLYASASVLRSPAARVRVVPPRVALLRTLFTFLFCEGTSYVLDCLLDQSRRGRRFCVGYLRLLGRCATVPIYFSCTGIVREKFVRILMLCYIIVDLARFCGRVRGELCSI